MSGFRQPEQNREQMVLWSQRLDDAIPEDHPVRHVDYLLRSAALSSTFAEWEQAYLSAARQVCWSRASHPITRATCLPQAGLSALYLHGMMNRIRSSRQLEAACYNRLGVIWLMPGQHPDHSTIADFVAQHGKQLRKLFRDVLRVAVDAEHGVIVAQDTSDAADDSGQLTPMLDQVSSHCGRLPDETRADSQYNTGPELARLEEAGVTGYLPDAGTRSEEKDGTSAAGRALEKVPRGEPLSEAEWSALPRDNTKFIKRVAFVYDGATDTYRCPAGHRLTYVQGSQDRKKWGVAKRRHCGGCSACASCPHARHCCKNPAKGRTVTRDQYEACRERLRLRMSEDVARGRYRLRRQTVEPRIGQIKHVLGFRRFLRRGLKTVSAEWSLACTAVNLGILLTHWKEVSAVL
jgi:transposase